jgi:hypothetical protein
MHSSAAERNPLRIFWLLWGDRSVGSSRVNGYLPHEYLVRHGVRSVLLLAPSRLIPDVPWNAARDRELAELVGSDIVVVQKMAGPRTEQLLHVLRESGATTVYVQGDFYPDVRAPFLCDVIVCDSRKLMDFYREGGAKHLAYIPDTLDFLAKRSEIARRSSRERELKICWHGSPDRWGEFHQVQEILREPEFADMELVTVSGHPEATIKWSVRRLRKAMRTCDIGIVPKGKWAEAVYKPSDRAVQFMAAGIPVIAERIPSYEEVITQGQTGYLADSQDEYRSALRALRNPETRRQIATRAYDLVRREFTQEATGEMWLSLFKSLMEKKVPRGTVAPPREVRLLNDLFVFAKLRHGRGAFDRSQYVYVVRDFSAAWTGLLRHPSLIRNYLSLLRRATLRGLQRAFRKISGRFTRTTQGG